MSNEKKVRGTIASAKESYSWRVVKKGFLMNGAQHLYTYDLAADHSDLYAH